MVPGPHSTCWQAFAKGQVDGPFELLAVKVLAMRMRIALKRDPSDEGLRKRSDEVYKFFVAHAELAAADLKRIAVIGSSHARQ